MDVLHNHYIRELRDEQSILSKPIISLGNDSNK